MDNACTPREKVECVSHALPQTYSGNYMAGQSNKKVVLEKAVIPSLYTVLKQRRMRWLGHVTRMKDGRIPKRPFIWRTGDREKTNRTTPTTLQGRMQARLPGTWHKLRLLGSYCHRQRCLETHNKRIRRNTTIKSGREKVP